MKDSNQRKRCQYPHGCGEPPKEGFRYCSKEHAPYGRYGLDKDGSEITSAGALMRLVDECEATAT